jgi:hypothetical protein
MLSISTNYSTVRLTALGAMSFELNHLQGGGGWGYATHGARVTLRECANTRYQKKSSLTLFAYLIAKKTLHTKNMSRAAFSR